MIDPAREAERSRIARLLYTRLEPAERDRLEAEYDTLSEQTTADVATDAAGSADDRLPTVEPLPVDEPLPLVEPVETRRRTRFAIGATVALALAVAGGVAAGWALAPQKSVATSGRTGLPTARSTPVRSDMLLVFNRDQVVTSDDASDVPVINVGSTYSAKTFRYLAQVQSPRLEDSVVGSVYAVRRASDSAVCLVVVSRTEFLADTCVLSGDIPSTGMAVSVPIQSLRYDITWRADGSVKVVPSSL